MRGSRDRVDEGSCVVSEKSDRLEFDMLRAASARLAPACNMLIETTSLCSLLDVIDTEDRFLPSACSILLR